MVAESKRAQFRQLRVAVLFAVFLVVGLNTILEDRKIAHWNQPLTVVLYPVLMEPGPEVESFVDDLQIEDFQPVADFVDREAKRWGVSVSPVMQLHLGETLQTEPPPTPDGTAPWYAVAWWSLKLRYWAATAPRHAHGGKGRASRPDIRLFVLYYRADVDRRLEHSVGLEKGHLGLIHAFATGAARDETHVAIAHELMHTVGATDKYTADGEPLFPDGYGDPAQHPLYPQTRAEIMAGHVALSADVFKLAESLEVCVIGPATAIEVHWSKTGEVPPQTE